MYEFSQAKFKENGNQVPPPALLNISYGVNLICLDKDVISDALLNTLEKFIERQEKPDLFGTAEFLIELSQKERIDKYI